MSSNNYEDIDALIDAGEQMVGSGDRPPKAELFTMAKIREGTEGHRVRLVENMIYPIYLHEHNRVVDGKETYFPIVCHGDHKYLNSLPYGERIDPDNCPICKYAMENGLKKLYPSPRFYTRVLDRIYQKELNESGQTGDDKIKIMVMKNSLFRDFAKIAKNEDYKIEGKGRDGLKTYKVDFTRFDVILYKEKTGPEPQNVKYSCDPARKDTPFTDAELELIGQMREKNIPDIDRFIRPAEQEYIDYALFGIKREDTKESKEDRENAEREREVRRAAPRINEGADSEF